jgi:hypothetical protein
MAYAEVETRQELMSAAKTPTTKQVFISMVLKASCNFFVMLCAPTRLYHKFKKFILQNYMGYPVIPIMTAAQGDIKRQHHV